MKKFSKILCFILAVIIIVSMSAMPLFAATNKNSMYGYRSVNFTPETPASSENSNKRVFLTLNDKVSIPSKYSAYTEGMVSKVKNQNPYGTCWAFSATSVAESTLYKKTGVMKDLSVLQLVNFFYNSKFDPLGNTGADKTENLSDTKLNQGGNHIFTTFALAGWTNGALEDTFAYTSTNINNVLSNKEIVNQYANDYDVAHLQNAYILKISDSESDMNAVKEAIMKYGSVAVSYYHNSSDYNSSNGSYYTKNTSSNHAVTIVGWNDNYSRKNFNGYTESSRSFWDWLFGRSGTSDPATDGAWLVKNSWGNSWGTDGDSDPNNKGGEGFFWISYCDKSLLSTGVAYVYDFEPTDNYKYNYQYDGSNGSSTYSVSSSEKVGAIYEVKGLTADYETIDGIGLGLYTTNVTGTAYIYKNPTDGNPASGELLSTVPFATTYEGFYTFPVNDAPKLAKGDKFSVVYKFDKNVSIFADRSYTNGSWIKFTADTANDKTYVVKSNGITNLGTSGYTARIKAYTNDSEGTAPENTYTISYNMNGGEGTIADQTKTEGSSITLSETIPTRFGYTFLGWAEINNATAADYAPGAIYSEDADLTLYAVWNLNLASAVYVNPSSVEFEYSGDSKTVTLSTNPSTELITDWSADYDTTALKVESVSANTYKITLLKDISESKTVTFTETNSGKTAVCTITQNKPEEPEIKINVSAKVEKYTERFLLIFKITKYRATITATAENTTISKVQYSTNGSSYSTGTTFTSSSNITKFYIRVYDAKNNVYNYVYDNGKVTLK